MKFISGIWVIVLAALVLLPISFAHISINPSVLTVDTFTNNPASGNISVTNLGNTSIFNINVTTTADVTFTTIAEIPAGQTKQINYNILTTSAFTATRNAVIFFFFAGNISLFPSSASINITQNGFQQQEVTVIQGSTVTWLNKDILKHTVTGSFADHELLQNASFSFVFNSPGTFNYKDNNANFIGKITVVEATQQQLIHDPNQDKTLSITINSVLVETNITAELLQANFTIEAGKTKQGVIKITNTGSQQARNIFLSGTWIFNKEDPFNLNPNEDRLIIFDITPSVSNSSETGKNYTQIINVHGTNILKQSFNLFITIPFQETIVRNESSSNIFRDRLALCREFPTADVCVTEPIEVQKNVTVFVNVPLPYNYSQEEVHRLNLNYLTLSTAFERMEGICNDKINTLSTTIDKCVSATETGSLNLKNIEEDTEQRRSLWLWGGGIVGFMTLGVGLFFGIKFALKQFTKFKVNQQ